MANGIVNNLPHGYRQAKESNDVPLRKFIYCADCNKPLTGYIVKQKKRWYYKCNTIGCRLNRSAEKMHEKFQELLSKYEVGEVDLRGLELYLLDLYYASINQSADVVKELKSKITDLNNKLDTLEERFAFGEIDRQVYEKISTKMKDEKAHLEEELSQVQIILSNPKTTVTKTVKLALKLNNLWVSRDFYGMKKLQELMFPPGVIYDREIDDYRTIEVNEIFREIASFSGSSGEIKAENQRDTLIFPL